MDESKVHFKRQTFVKSSDFVLYIIFKVKIISFGTPCILAEPPNILLGIQEYAWMDTIYWQCGGGNGMVINVNGWI